MHGRTLLHLITMLVAVIVSALLPGGCSRGSAGIILAEDGKSEYRIVVAADAAEKTLRAAAELQAYLEEITGAKLPVITDLEDSNRREIIVGNSSRLKQLEMGEEVLDSLKSGGFILRTLDRQLVIAGASDLGDLYGVYAFLEDVLGCRWYTSSVSKIPRISRIELNPLDTIQNPVFGWRAVYYHDYMNPDFADRMRINGNAGEIDSTRIVRGKMKGWGRWVHTLYSYVSPEKYFDEHPEYFSLVDGKRRHVKGQLCLSNPDVFRILTESLKQAMAESPEDRIWSVSQMDGWGGYCECEDCKAINEREGGPSGSVIEFVNRVAARFPDYDIATLAYTYTKHPPLTLRPAANVPIVLCSYEVDRQQTIPGGERNQSFRQDIENWARVCGHLVVWDYQINFRHLLNPYPNFHILQDNFKFFAANNVKGIFAQGNNHANGEFCGLRGYLLAKLLWNPSCDLDYHKRDYLEGYFQEAAGPMGRYIELMAKALQDSGNKMGIYDDPDRHSEGFLSREMIARYDTLFDEAEQLSAGNPEILARVRKARLPLMNVKLQLKLGTLEQRRTLATEFFHLVEQAGVYQFSEIRHPRDEYRELVFSTLEQEAGQLQP